MELKKLVVNVKEVWVDFPGLSGFKVKVANLSRKELLGLRKRCTVQKFDRKTRQLNEELDDEKFIVEFTGAVVKGWEGLTLEHLETLLLIDTEGKDMSEGSLTVLITQKYLSLLQLNLILGSTR